jgi:hypothetical protein
MKQKDIALIIVIAAISGVLSFIVSQYIFGSPQNSQQSVAVVDVITTDFTTPDTKFFNNNSINPAKLIEIGSSNNSNPFGGVKR